MVRGVLVCACACVWAWGAAAAAVEVRQEVERIFKTVDSLMKGEKPDLQISQAGPMTKKSFVSEESQLPSGTNDFKEGDASLPAASDRAYPGGPGPGPVSFPVGVILSDNLYPLVVGRNLETGVPFVMNLNKQHALVVARGGSSDYRMVIPFPVVVPQPHDDPSESQYRSAPPVVPKRYPLKTPYYPLYGNNLPKKYLVDHQTYGKYYDESSHTQHDSSLNPRDYPYDPHKVTGKYASHYQSYGSYASDDASKFDDSRYKQSPHKKYIKKPNYINYFGVDHKPAPAVSGKYIPYSIDQPGSKYRVRNYTRYHSPSGDVSYHVAGPKYTPTLPLSHKYHSSPQSYRTTIPGGSPTGHRYLGPTKQHSPLRQSPQSYRGSSGPLSDGPKDFKPSPYLGSIPEDRPSPSTPSPLETQSEEFESYDDREPDYVETTGGRTSSSVGVESSGGVRHVTHHADDYLGKIYEDMYYKVAPNTYSDGPPSYEADEQESRSRSRNATSEDASLARTASTSTSTSSRTGPVTFYPPQELRGHPGNHDH